ncbi:hypothetical protein vseg_006446 [Gypsophila vaccaria]
MTFFQEQSNTSTSKIHSSIWHL